MSLNDPSFDGRTDHPTDGKDGPPITDPASVLWTAADRRQSRAAIRTENRLLRARAVALERELSDSHETNRCVIQRYERLLSEHRARSAASERGASDSAPASRLRAIASAVRDRVLRW